MRKLIIGGNWKMQVTTVEKSVIIARELSQAMEDLSALDKIDVFICPSFNSLYSLKNVLNGKELKLGAQNVYSKNDGAFTGEISIESLIECGVDYVLLGHSERRRIFNENSDFINSKVHKVLDSDLKAVLCIGETAEERKRGLVKEVNWDQLTKSLMNVSRQELENVIIAYEPVWAINNKYLNPDSEIRPATEQEANESHKIVRHWFEENFNATIAQNIRIMYGGSMNKDNCSSLLGIQDIDGGLIGGASLSKEKFIPIIKNAIMKN